MIELMCQQQLYRDRALHVQYIMLSSDVQGSEGSIFMATKDGRGRDFRFLVYPESMDKDWKLHLESYCVPMWMSPLHQPDEDEEGHQSKPHYHVIMSFKGKKSPDSVKEIAMGIFGQGCCFPPAHKFQVHSMEGAVRYLVHADDPDKEQFEGGLSAIQLFYGADAEIYFLRNNDISKVVREVQEFARTNHISSFAAILDYAAVMRPDWHAVMAKKCTFALYAYCKSLHYELHDQDNDDFERVQALIEDKILEEKEMKAIEAEAKEIGKS